MEKTMRMFTDSSLYDEYRVLIDAAADEAAVRAVLRQLQSDARSYHAVAHRVNALARARIAALRDQESGIRDQNVALPETAPVPAKKAKTPPAPPHRGELKS